MERYLRDAHHIYAPAGTSDIQLQRLAETALGLAKGDYSRRFTGAEPAAPHPATAAVPA